MPHPYDWKPVRHSVLRDAALAERLHVEGVSVEPFLDAAQLEALRELYLKHHSIPRGEGGMFYSVYSQDLSYREMIHAEVQAILKPTLERWFQGYKNVVNSFVVKIPGKASEFSIHQDMTALDEFRFSPLSVWIPLWDIHMESGPMCVAPRTHGMFSPYRGISFAFPFAGIMETVRRYLRPVLPKAGEAILFDPRILHNSLPNNSERERVALICGIFPEDATMMNCFQETKGGPIDLYVHDDDYLLKYPNFMHNCHARPVSGSVVAKVEEKFQPWSADDFVAAANAAGLHPANALPEESAIRCHMIAEPDAEQRAPLVQLAASVEHAAVQAAPAKKGFFERLFGK